MENHSDPSYIRNFMAKSPVAAGQNTLTVICCNYWLLKNVAGPFLAASAGVQNGIIGTNECVTHTRNKWNNSTLCGSHSRLSMSDSAEDSIEEGLDYGKDSRYEDEKKGRNQRIAAASVIILSKLVHYFTISFSVGLVLVFVYAAFTV